MQEFIFIMAISLGSFPFGWVIFKLLLLKIERKKKWN
jgi:hypothetical protein